MSFRKRNAPVLGVRGSQTADDQPSPTIAPPPRLPGTRPSAVDGRLVTSTGTTTLDSLLAGHGGLALGTSLLIEESGTTDYAGALLRFYAAEGLLQGHHVHVVALPESWGRDLPAQTTERKEKNKAAAQETDRMKIAWRYEKLGAQDIASRDRIQAPSDVTASSNDQVVPFSHSFDLTKRLTHPPDSRLNFINVDPSVSKNPFAPALSALTAALLSSPPSTVHRLILPSLLSPALYPPHPSIHTHLLATFRILRSLLSSQPARLTIITTLPTSLYPRSSGLTRWLEILCDGVFELLPFPHSSDAEFAVSRDPNTKEEPPQGLLRIHKLPILHETGSGVSPSDMDWTFTLSRRKFTIKPFNLPPIEGDTEAQQSATSGAANDKPKKADMEF